VATTTSVGCSFTKSLAVRSKQCATTSAAIVVSPSPTARPSASRRSPAPPPGQPKPTANPPFNPGASSYPPFNRHRRREWRQALITSAAGQPASFVDHPGSRPLLPPAVYAGGPGSGASSSFPGGLSSPILAARSPRPHRALAPRRRLRRHYGGFVGGGGMTYDARYSNGCRFHMRGFHRTVHATRIRSTAISTCRASRVERSSSSAPGTVHPARC